MVYVGTRSLGPIRTPPTMAELHERDGEDTGYGEDARSEQERGKPSIAIYGQLSGGRVTDVDAQVLQQPSQPWVPSISTP